MSESTFFQDLAMLMTIAGFVAVVFSRLKWPKVIGYILAGIVMSEYTWGGSFLTDVGSTRTIGQLGVVFLMFGMGLSFSPTEMRRIRFVALPAALVDTFVMIWLGYTIGTRLFGWAPAPALFLGVAICDSATTLLAKVIDEMGWSNRPFAKYVLGTSVCEDIICVGAIAVATGFARGGGLSAGAFLLSVFSLMAFFLTVLVFGFILLPRLLASVGKRADDEALVLTILGSCFFVSYLAYRFDYSLALGAFLVGILGGSSIVRERLARLTDPLKAMFSAVFFVSIGLLVNPSALWNCLPQILLVSAVVIFGKFTANFAVSLALGQPLKQAIQTGFGLAQIGEFAFMVAILYAGIVSDAENPLFPIAVGVSLLTTLVNPWMLRLSEAVGNLAESRVPARFQQGLQTYQIWLDKLRVTQGSPTSILIRSSALKLGVCAVLLFSVAVAFALLQQVDYSRFSQTFERFDTLFFFAAFNLFALGLAPIVLATARSLGDEIALVLVGESGSRWTTPMRQMTRFVVTVGVCTLLSLEWLMMDITLAPLKGYSAALTLLLVAVIGVCCWSYFVKASRRAASRFEEALTADERREGFDRMTTVSLPEGTIQRFTLTASSPAIGESVVTLNIRAKTGASVVSVFRDGRITRNIGPEWEFCVGDTLVALGDPSQIAALKDLLGVIA